MNEFRVFLSVSIFILSSYFVIDIIWYGFNWLLLTLSLLGFISCHYIWPEKKNDESAWYDLIEIVIELPFRCLTLFIRGLGKITKNSDSGFDI